MWYNKRYCTSNKTGNARIKQYRWAFVQLLLQWKSNQYHIFWVCICSLRYPACNAHAPYFHLWNVRLYDIFKHYLIKGKILEKKKWLNKNVSFNFLNNIRLKNFSFWEGMSDTWLKIYVLLHVKYPIISSNFNETLIFSTYFKKIVK